MENNNNKQEAVGNVSELSDLLASSTRNKELSTCNGIIFKASIKNSFSCNGSLSYKVCLTPVKRKSCHGCEKCGWQSDNLCEVSESWPIHGIEKCEHGKLYRLKTCNESKDFETGQIDSWDLCLVEIAAI